MKRALLTIVILILAITATVGCGSDSGGQSQPPSGQQGAPAGGQGASAPGGAGGPSGQFGVSGTVKSVSGSTIQVTMQDGSTSTVKVDDQTSYSKIATATLADIKAGVVVMVSSDQTGTAVTAKSIQIGAAGQAGGPGGQPGQGNGPGTGQGARTPGAGGPGGQPAGTPAAGGPGGVARPGAAGTVKSVSGNTIVVTAQDSSTVTVTVNDKTTYQKTTTGALADVTAGTRITVMGETSNGTTTARFIQIGGTGQ